MIKMDKDIYSHLEQISKSKIESCALLYGSENQLAINGIIRVSNVFNSPLGFGISRKEFHKANIAMKKNPIGIFHSHLSDKIWYSESDKELIHNNPKYLFFIGGIANEKFKLSIFQSINKGIKEHKYVVV